MQVQNHRPAHSYIPDRDIYSGHYPWEELGKGEGKKGGKREEKRREKGRKEGNSSKKSIKSAKKQGRFFKNTRGGGKIFWVAIKYTPDSKRKRFYDFFKSIM